MSLLDLNDDVLLSIFSHLYGDNALNVALTCSKAYQLAIPRVAAVVECQTSDQLQRLHAYLCGHGSRLRYVESLEIASSVFWPPNHAQDVDFRSHIHGDFFHALRVGDMLIGAERLRRLCLPRLLPLIRTDPRILPAVLSLNNLSFIALDTVGDSCITALRAAPFRNLRTLWLSYHNDSVGFGMPIDGEPITSPPLLRLLSTFPHLQSFKLQFFVPTRVAASAPDGKVFPVAPCFSSIHELRLYDVASTAFDLIAMCPKLSTLDLGLRGGRYTVPYPAHVRWPSLRQLRVKGQNELICAANLLSSVHHLEVVNFVTIGQMSSLPGRVCPDQLLDALRQTSPVSARLWVVACYKPGSFWPQVTKAAPRLRVLRLHISKALHMHMPNFGSWLVRSTFTAPKRISRC